MEYVSNNTFGSLTSAPDGKIIEKIFIYLTTVLSEIKGNPDENENSITARLCRTLGFKKPPEYPFFFQHQNIEDSRQNTSTDFAAFGSFAYAHAFNQQGENFPLVKFEAKRLNARLPRKREREYVIGEYDQGKQIKNSGGIERFKNQRHGKDVFHAGIIGYVQTDSFDFWINKINNLVKDEIEKPHDLTLIWDSDDYLKFIWLKNNISGYLSKPKRKNLTHMNMHHIWVKLL
jgi:hypothetical protein